MRVVDGEYDYFNIDHKEPEMTIMEFAEMYREIGGKLSGYNGDIVRRISDDKDCLTDNLNRRCYIITKAEILLLVLRLNINGERN